MLADVVRLALNHGDYDTRVAPTAKEAAKALADWQPYLVVLDIDTGGGRILEGLAGATRWDGGLPGHRADIAPAGEECERKPDETL